MAVVVIRPEGLEESANESQAQADRALDLSAVLAVIAVDIETFIDDRFKSGTDPGGNEWRPLAAATIAARRGTNPKPLIDTGTLRGSITTDVDNASILLGTNVPYAGFHQFGTTTIPARPFLPFTEDNEVVSEGPAAKEFVRYAEMIATYIETGEITEG